MRVFITGASGWIGSHTVDEFLSHGYEVIGLARSDSSAAALEAKGATVLRGDLDNLASLRAGAEAADAVVHLANKHDFGDPVETNRAERAAVQTIGDALAGTGKGMLLASGVAGLAQGRPALETDASPAIGPDSPRGGTENLAFDYVDKGIKSISLRFSPTTHGMRDHGFMAIVSDAAKRNGFAGYVGDGSTGWAAVHVADAASMIRLGVEKAPAGARLHAVAEESVASKDIAEAIARSLGLEARSFAPEESQASLGGFIGTFWGMDLAASSAATRELLGWAPTGPTLLDDIRAGAYTA